MSRNFIIDVLVAFFVRGPFALAVFYASVSQNKFFESDQIIFLGKILSYSVVFSIVFLQPLGNIFNKTIPSLFDKSVKKFSEPGILLLFLVIPVVLVLPALFFEYFLFYSISLAISQASFQWSLSYLTVKDSKTQLVFSSIIVSILLFIITYSFFKNNYLDVYYWLSLLILCYSIPSIVILYRIFEISFIENFKQKLIVFFKKFVSAASFYSLLSFLFWLVEFYPRIVKSFGDDFIVSFNVYMTVAIGLIGAIDIGLSQVFLKDYLNLVASKKKKFKLFFFNLFKFYAVVYLLIFLILYFFEELYWSILFDNSRFENVELFLFIFTIEILRILTFHSYNVFYYLGELKKIRANLFLFSVVSFFIVLLSIFNLISGFNYLISFLIVMFFTCSLNLFKVHRLL